MAQQQQQQQMPPDPAAPASGATGPAPAAPRKFAYLKHLTALHKDQHTKLQAKNAQVRNRGETVEQLTKLTFFS